MKKLSIFDKWKIVNNYLIENGQGELFDPEIAHQFYGINFLELKPKKHYKVYETVSIGANGVKPILSMYFTPKGIKKLLKTNQKMRDEVEQQYQELINDNALKEALSEILRGGK